MEAVDPFFRQYFLFTIQNIIQQDPSSSSLLELLQTVNPNLTLAQLSESIDRNKAFKLLKLRIHPDKHLQGDLNQATKIFQDFQEFYQQCCEQLQFDNEGVIIVNTPSSSSKNKRRKNRSTQESEDSQETTIAKVPSQNDPSASIHYPESFTVFVKWEYMTTDSPHFPTNSHEIMPIYQSAIRAFQCLNARGAIAHGKKITKGFTYEEHVQLYPSKNYNRKNIHIPTMTKESTVVQIFETLGGGCKFLNTDISLIKKELLHHGPVVSLSFRPSSNYLKFMNTHHTHFSQEYIKDEEVMDCQEMLIVGWEITVVGEVWLCQPLYPDSVEHSTFDAHLLHSSHRSTTNTKNLIRIAFRQFGIEDRCIAPKLTTLDHICWQSGPYFDVDFSDSPDWREWDELELPLVDSELKKMFHIFFPNGFSKVYSENTPIVLRDKNKAAHCNTYIASDLKWNESTNEWFMILLRKA